MVIKRYTSEELEQMESETDWEAVDAMTDEELRQAAESDPDNPPLTDEDFAKMRPAKEVLPPELYEQLTQKKRSKSSDSSEKILIKNFRLSSEVVEYFKATGPGWEARIDHVLKTHVRLHK